jgi:hypothetical protein
MCYVRCTGIISVEWKYYFINTAGSDGESMVYSALPFLLPECYILIYNTNRNKVFGSLEI